MAEYTTVANGIEQLTRFQRVVYDYMYERTLQDGAPPTVREIASQTGLSPTAVFHHIEKMKGIGLVKADIERRRYRLAGTVTRIDISAPLYNHVSIDKEEKVNAETLDN